MQSSDNHQVRHAIGVEMHDIIYRIIFQREPLKYFRPYCVATG